MSKRSKSHGGGGGSGVDDGGGGGGGGGGGDMVGRAWARHVIQRILCGPSRLVPSNGVP